MSFFLLLYTKEDIWKKMPLTKQLMDPIDYFFSYYGGQWGPLTVWFLIFFKISYLLFSNSHRFGTTRG